MRILFVIDMQNDFIDGSLGTAEAVGIVANVAKKIREFDGDEIIATLDTHFNDTYRNTLEGEKLPVPHCFEGTHGHQLNGAVLSALEARGNFRIVKKYTFGSLDMICELKKKLENEPAGDTEFEMIGLCTDICVASNALLLRAAFPDSRITVDAACCAGVTPELHDAALKTLRSCQIDVVNTCRPPEGEELNTCRSNDICEKTDADGDAYELDYIFDPAAQRDGVISWIKDWFDRNGPDSPAVIGISGGKDSTVVAALCARALGADRVVGVMMPDGVQPDIDDSKKAVKALGIKAYTVNIADATGGVLNAIDAAELTNAGPVTVTKQMLSNLPPRIRMTTLYAVSQSMNGRVANTCNLSETMIGWETKWGDAVGDFSPLSGLTATEVVAIGLTMPEIPRELVVKAPSDGLCGRTDEDAFGFKYAQLDHYLRSGEADPEVKEQIDAKIRGSAFKRAPIAGYDSGLPRRA